MDYTISNANTHAQITENTPASGTNTNHATKHSHIHTVYTNQSKQVRYCLWQVTNLAHSCVNILKQGFIQFCNKLRWCEVLNTGAVYLNLHKRCWKWSALPSKSTSIHTELLLFIYTYNYSRGTHNDWHIYIYTYNYIRCIIRPLHFLPPHLARSAGLYLTLRGHQHLRCLVLSGVVRKRYRVVIVNSNELDGNSFP